jgi:hypothetical protein
VHADLLAAGVIPDPFDAADEKALTWIGRTDWTYTARFTWRGNDHQRHDLVAQGLDTVASVFLNGEHVAPREVAELALPEEVVTPVEPRGEYLVARTLPSNPDPVVTTSAPATTPATAGEPVAGEPVADPAFWYFVEDPELRLHPLGSLISAHVLQRPGGYRLTIATTGLVKDLTLLVDRIHPSWQVDTGMVTLDGGDRHTFDVDTRGIGGPAPALDVWCAPTVLRSANGLVVR